MFLISNRVDRYENFNSIKLVNNIYLFYDCNCEFEFIGNNLVIGRQYQGVVSDKDGTYVEVELDNVDSGCIKFNRDFWGGVPLYYYNDGLIVSDSLSLIKKIIGPSAPNYGAIAEYISSAYNVGNRTVYSDVNVLMPDESLKVEISNENLLSVIQNPPFEKIDVKDEGTLLKMIEDTLTLSIENFITKQNKKNDSKCYLNLSGGVDSSLILAKMKEYDKDFNISSLIYYHTDWRRDIVDHEFSKIACTKYNIDSKKVDIDNEIYSKYFEIYINRTKNVMHTYAPSFYFMNATGISDGKGRVIINGSGPDESMIGTEKLSINKIKQLDRKKLVNKENFLIHNIDYLKIPVNVASEFFKKDICQKFGDEVDFFKYRADVATHMHNNFGGDDCISELQRKYHFYTILQDHIKNIYESCQQSGADVFFPYLTNDLFILIFSANFYQLNIENEYKSIMKKILIKYFPKDYVYREKIGFQSPSTPYFIPKIGMGRKLRECLNVDSKIFSSKYNAYILRQINEKEVDLYKRYDYSIWAYLNIRTLENNGNFKI
jgi:asparagine synthase (glutamine-hydrolysing)